MKQSLTLLAVVACMTSANAEVLWTESFSYPNGNLVGNGPWANLSGTGTFLQVSDGQLTGLAHGSGSREDAVAAFTSTALNTGSIFASFSFVVNSAPTSGQDYFFLFNPPTSTSLFYARTYLGAGTETGTFRIGISGASNTVDNIGFTSNLIPGEEYFIVVGLNIDAGSSTIWVGSSLDSLSFGSPSATAGDLISGTFSVARVAFRQGNSVTSANSMDFDNLVVGTTFASVTGAIPEPSTYAAIFGVAVLGLAAMRRRRA